MCDDCSCVLRAFNWSSLHLHPVYACVHLFVHQATHQDQVSANDEDSHGFKFVLRVAFCWLDGSFFGRCEDEVGLIVNGGENALVGTAVDGNDSDDTLRLYGQKCKVTEWWRSSLFRYSFNGMRDMLAGGAVARPVDYECRKLAEWLFQARGFSNMGFEVNVVRRFGYCSDDCCEVVPAITFW